MEGIPRETRGRPGTDIDPNCSFFDEGGGRSDLLQKQTRETLRGMELLGESRISWDDSVDASSMLSQ